MNSIKGRVKMRVEDCEPVVEAVVPCGSVPTAQNSAMPKLPTRDEWKSLVADLELTAKQAHNLYAWLCRQHSA